MTSHQPSWTVGEQAAAHVAGAASDAVIVLSSSSESTLFFSGETRNAQNRLVAVHNIQAREGAGRLVEGLVSSVNATSSSSAAAAVAPIDGKAHPPLFVPPHPSSSSVSIFAPSYALEEMSPSIHRLAHQGGVVVNVEAFQVNDKFEISNNDRESSSVVGILKRGGRDVVALASSSAQEMHDNSLIAHAASLLANAPVVHIFERATSKTEESGAIRLAEKSKVAETIAIAINKSKKSKAHHHHHHEEKEEKEVIGKNSSMLESLIGGGEGEGFSLFNNHNNSSLFGVDKMSGQQQQQQVTTIAANVVTTITLNEDLATTTTTVQKISAAASPSITWSNINNKNHHQHPPQNNVIASSSSSSTTTTADATSTPFVPPAATSSFSSPSFILSPPLSRSTPAAAAAPHHTSLPSPARYGLVSPSASTSSSSSSSLSLETRLYHNPSHAKLVDAVAEAMAIVGRDASSSFSSRDLVSYSGATDAQVVFVGAAVASTRRLEAAILRRLQAEEQGAYSTHNSNDIHNNSSSDSSSSFKVGLLSLRLVYPVPVAALLRELPRTVRRVVVLGDNDNSNALTSEIAAALRTFRAQGRRPIVTRFSGEDVESEEDVLEQVWPRSPSSSLTARDGLRVGFWESSSSSSAASIALDAIVEKSSSGLAASRRRLVLESSSSSSFAVTLARLGSDGDKSSSSSLALAPRSLQYLGIHDQGALSDNVAELVADEGIILVNKTTGDLASGLSSKQLASLVDRKIRLFAVDALSVVNALNNNNNNAAATATENDVLAAVFLGLIGWTSPSVVQSLGVQQVDIVEEIKNMTPSEDDAAAASSLTIPHEKLFSTSSSSSTTATTTNLARRACWALLFPQAHNTERRLFADEDNLFQVKLSCNRRLTPGDYERNVFHLEFDIRGTGLKYNIGDALAVAGQNSEEEVLEFFSWYGIDPKAIVALPLPRFSKNHNNNNSSNDSSVQLRTALQAFVQNLDIFGRPTKAMYEQLLERATDARDKEVLERIVNSSTNAAGAEDLKRRTAETLTIADTLKEFASARPSLAELVHFVPFIKTRLYSVSSSMKAHPDSIHLLVVTHDWMTPSGKRRIGLCTRYLESLPVGSLVTVTLKPSVMKLPASLSQPIVMAGLGTGMAPFRAFIEERTEQYKQQQQLSPSSSFEMGSMSLYFGSRTRHAEYLYGEELEAYHDSSLLTHLRLAFSRDQDSKVYIQHLIKQDGMRIADILLRQNGHFYLCGPTWPVNDIKNALIESFLKSGAVKTHKEGDDLLEELKEEGRYVLEVY